MFHFSCLFAFIIFLSSKPDIKNNAKFDAMSRKRANFDEVQCKKNTKVHNIWHI